MLDTVPSFETILDRFQPLIYATIYRYHLERHLDDYYQVGCIGLWEAYRRYDQKKGTFAAFASYKVKGAILDALRKQARYDQHHLLATSNTPIDQQDTRYDELFTQVELQETFSFLTDNQKKWAINRILYGLSIPEIAHKHQTSIATVKYWRRSAISKMKQHMVSYS